MRSPGLDTSTPPVPGHQIEVELLTQVRRAEAEFKQAPAEQKEQAGELFRRALEQFSRQVLDRRFPPGFSLRP